MPASLLLPVPATAVLWRIGSSWRCSGESGAEVDTSRSETLHRAADTGKLPDVVLRDAHRNRSAHGRGNVWTTAVAASSTSDRTGKMEARPASAESTPAGRTVRR